MKLHPNVIHHFSHYPVDRLWYLLFDYNRRDLGPAGFEDVQDRGAEVGYMSGMFSGLDYILRSVDTPLSLDFLDTLHQKATNSVHLVQKIGTEDGIKNEFYSHNNKFRRDKYGIEFGLVTLGETTNVTRAGFQELLDQIRLGDSYFRVQYDSTRINADFLKTTEKSDDTLYREVVAATDKSVVIAPKNPGTISYRISKIYSDFQAAINQPNLSDDQKIAAIAECVHWLEVTHPFEDANGRTMYLLMNKLLLQQDLSPSILKNPNRIDAYSTAELAQEIKDGQARFSKQYLRQSDNKVNLQQDDTVLFLQDNKAVAALLVHQAIQRVDHWDNINVGDREYAIDKTVDRICAFSPQVKSGTVASLKDTIKNNMSAAVYQKSFYQLGSRHGLFYKEVASKIVQGKFSDATQQLSSGNQYGIELNKL